MISMRFLDSDPTAENPIRISLGSSDVAVTLLNNIPLLTSDILVSPVVFYSCHIQTSYASFIMLKTAPITGGGDIFPSTPATTNFTVGDFPAGSTIGDRSLIDVLTDILVGYPQPTLTSLNFTGRVATIEVGSVIAANRNFTWSMANADNMDSASISISGPGGVVQGTGITGVNGANTYLSTTPAINTTDTPATYSFGISGTNTKGATITGSGVNVATQYRFGYAALATDGGLVTATDINDLLSATGTLRATPVTNISFPANPVSPYKYFVAPASFPLTTDNFKEGSASGFPYAMVKVADNVPVVRNANATVNYQV